MQPDEKDYVEQQPSNHADHVVAPWPGFRSRDEPSRGAALQRDTGEHGISEERAEQDDRGEVAMGSDGQTPRS